MSYLISDDYLMHHGVKGMKWGVRHDKPTSGTTRRMSANSKKSNRFKLSTGTKVALALTGAAAGAMVAPALIKYGKTHADDIMRAGTKIQTLHQHPELVTEGKKFYTTNKAIDKIKYKASFGKNHLGIKKQITGTVEKNIKIAGGNTGRNTMLDLAKSDDAFAKYIDSIYGDKITSIKNFNDSKNLTRNQKRLLNDVYFKFNRRSLLGEADAETTKFINALKDKGYGGVADLNDRRGWGTSANILFDNKNIGNIQVRQMNQRDIAKAQQKAAAVEATKLTVAAYSPYVAAGSALAAASGISEDKAIHDRANKRKRN